MSPPIPKTQPSELHVPGDALFQAALIHGAPVGMMLLSSNFHVLYLNESAAAFLAKPLRSDQPRTIMDIVHHEDAERLAFALSRCRLNARQAVTAEIRFIRNDCPVWMLLSMSALERAGTEPFPEILLQMADIDQRKQEEGKHLVWEERWNSALVSSTLGVWDHDFKKGTMYYSDTWKKLRGLAPHEEINAEMDVWLQSVHPDDRAHVVECIRRQIEGEVSSSFFEYRERHKDGHWVWIECRGSCIEWDDSGRPTRIVGTDLDITERKQIEEEFHLLSRRLDLALKVTRIGVFEADLTEESLLLDDRLLSIFDMEDRPNLQGPDDWIHVIHPDDLDAARGKIAEGLDEHRDFSNHFRIVRKDGTIRHIRARVAPFEDHSGHAKLIGANWDVTEDILVREELERARLLTEARNKELELAKAKIEHSALHDFLTELPNRRFLDTKLGFREGANGLGLAILHIDLDRFKQINDTMGHLAGDTMLLHAAKVLRENLSEGEFAARIGGDEFVILSDFAGDRDRLGKLARTIIQRMREPVHVNGTACRIGASIGIAFDMCPDVDARQLLLNADIALYRAKASGRNRYEFFSADIQAHVVHTKRVSDEILVGLENREFVPHYQLQFCANTLDIIGVETLARWHHPSRGILSPESYFAIAEDLDAAESIDAMILEKALVDFASWQAQGIPIPKISTNVSTRRLYDADLGAKLAGAGIRPGTVSFELLETIFLDDCDEDVLKNLEIIRSMGIGIEIDDFGTGHASIISLLKVNPDTLKIDKALISPVVDMPEQRKLVRSIIEIGKSLGIRVVAEGIETRQHAEILRDLGCDILQGFALARPMPFEGIESFVFQKRWR